MRALKKNRNKNEEQRKRHAKQSGERMDEFNNRKQREEEFIEFKAILDAFYNQ